MIKFASICPHPPLIIPTIGAPDQRNSCNGTIKAMKQVGKKFKEKRVEKLIIISPHLPLNQGSFTLFDQESYKGDFEQFGDTETDFSFPGAVDLASEIKNQALKEEISTKISKIPRLDHGTLVHLFYLTGPGKKSVKVLPLSFSAQDLKPHYEFGTLIGKIVKNSEDNIGICASGDMSHRLTPSAPGGFSPQGEKFDQKLKKLIQEKKPKQILNMNPGLIEKAGECGLRSVVILLGLLSNFNWEPEILSYEGPFGVGYLVADIRIKSSSFK